MAKCKICGREFEAEHGNQKVCSLECDAENKRRHSRKQAAKQKAARRHKVKCQICGVEFETTGNQKYCSLECAKAGKSQKTKESIARRGHKRQRNPPHKVKCEICGKEFETANPHQKLCSSECRKEQARRQNLAHYYSKKKAHKKKCKMCGREFETDQGNQKYCSPECAAAARRQQNKESMARYNRKKQAARLHKVKCKICGREFETINPLKKCCSEACSIKNGYNHCKARYYQVTKPARMAAVVRPKKPEPAEAKKPAEIKKPAAVKKTFADWTREAAECNLDYGTYRGLISLGKTYEELKAQASMHSPRVHQHTPHREMGEQRG